MKAKKYNVTTSFTSIISLMFVLASLSVQAQSVKVGLKGGLNVANIQGGGASKDNSFRPGLHLGLYGIIKIDEQLGFIAEILYSQKGTITKVQPAPFNVRIDYIDIPLLFSYSFNESFSGHVGLEVSTPVAAQVNRSGEPTRYFLYEINKAVLSLPIGILYEMESGINFGARVDLGVSAIGGDRARNNVLMFSIGYSFLNKSN